MKKREGRCAGAQCRDCVQHVEYDFSAERTLPTSTVLLGHVFRILLYDANCDIVELRTVTCLLSSRLINTLRARWSLCRQRIVLYLVNQFWICLCSLVVAL